MKRGTSFSEDKQIPRYAREASTKGLVTRSRRSALTLGVPGRIRRVFISLLVNSVRQADAKQREHDDATGKWPAAIRDSRDVAILMFHCFRECQTERVSTGGI